MSKELDEISPKLAAWIAEQRVFFVATAPLSAAGRVNVSPKGGDAFRVLGPMEAAYLDLTGSGAETAAHLRENGRICIMFCAFSGPPRIVRLHGRGSVIVAGDAEYDEMARSFGESPGARAVMRIAVDRVSESCGFGAPLMDYRADRDTLERWAVKQGPEGVARYRMEKNRVSLDGLPAFDPPPPPAAPPTD